MLKVQIKPTLQRLATYVRGATWTSSESTELLELVNQIRDTITYGTKPTRTQKFITKIKSGFKFK